MSKLSWNQSEILKSFFVFEDPKFLQKRKASMTQNYGDHLKPLGWLEFWNSIKKNITLANILGQAIASYYVFPGH